MGEALALPWQVCLAEAWAAYCDGALPIGACVGKCCPEPAQDIHLARPACFAS
jgi:hypothetical protein